MRIYFYTLLLLLPSCSNQTRDTGMPRSTISYVNSSFAQSLTRLIDRIELGDLEAWSDFKRHNVDLDGEFSQTYAVACSEILTRDPSFFLRRYLAGESDVVPYAKFGYRFVGTRGRQILDEIYERRLSIAQAHEAELIQSFINETTFPDKI